MLLGKEARLPIRLVCHKLTEEQSKAEEEEKLIFWQKVMGTNLHQLMQWAIFITNIPVNKIGAEDIWTIYRSRWYLEYYVKYMPSYM